MGTRLTASALEAVVDGILQCYGYLPPKEKRKLQARLKKRTAHKKRHRRVNQTRQWQG